MRLIHQPVIPDSPPHVRNCCAAEGYKPSTVLSGVKSFRSTILEFRVRRSVRPDKDTANSDDPLTDFGSVGTILFADEHRETFKPRRAPADILDVQSEVSEQRSRSNQRVAQS